MPILVKTVVDRTLSLLDAEGSDRYTFDQDFKPSINSAIETIVTMFNEAFAEKKLSPEVLRELVKTKVWQANQYSRFSYSDADTGHPLWSVIAIYPKPVTNQGAASSSTTDKSESKFRGDLSFIKSDFSAKRLTMEEWNLNQSNVFMPGNNVIKGGLQEYAYLDPGDFTSSTYTGNPGQIEFSVRPDIPGELVAMAYIKYPTNVATINDSLEFPQSMTTLIVRIVANYISYKQGDGTNLFAVTRDEIGKLVNLIKQ